MEHAADGSVRRCHPVAGAAGLAGRRRHAASAQDLHAQSRPADSSTHTTQAIRDVLAAHPRFHLHFTPTSASWLNAVETWFGQLERRALRGAEALWGRQTMAGLASGGVASGNRLDGEVGYGLPVGRRFVGTPWVGVSTSEHGRDYRIGYGLGVSRAANVESG